MVGENGKKKIRAKKNVPGTKQGQAREKRGHVLRINVPGVLLANQ